VSIKADLGIELSSHRLPDLTRDQLVKARTARLLDDPTEHVGEYRAVAERATVLALPEIEDDEIFETLLWLMMTGLMMTGLMSQAPTPCSCSCSHSLQRPGKAPARTA
jgi:hypothetical protein